jgi:hypothetical protein
MSEELQLLQHHQSQSLTTLVLELQQKVENLHSTTQILTNSLPQTMQAGIITALFHPESNNRWIVCLLSHLSLA